MIGMTLGEVSHVIGARLMHADPSTMVTGSVEYDSRKAGSGGLFLALPGERVDGHDYATAAISAGCVAVIASRDTGVPTLLVDDGIAAISALAAHVVRRVRATVIGITGSSGKTSTKDLIAQVLATHGDTVAAVGSANNELGFPYTVLKVTPATRFLVLELGARGLGHIRRLTDIAPLHIAAVLNVGSAHLGEFGSRGAIAQAKGEIVENLPADGVAVLNAADPLVWAMAPRTVARVVGFGDGGEVYAGAVGVDELDRPHFELCARGRRAQVQLRVSGEHQVANALAAGAVALSCGMTVEDVARALNGARSTSPWRMEITERPDGVTVINDAYNANPESMRAALGALARVGAPGRATRTGQTSQTSRRTFAVLGPMAELGQDTETAHRELGAAVARADIARLIAVGTSARPIVAGARLAGSWSGRADTVAGVAEAVALLRAELAPGDVVLVKASRSASLEQVALAIAHDDSRAEPAASRQSSQEGAERG